MLSILKIVGTISLAIAAANADPGLPADFPSAPALSACKPVIAGPEVICDWQNIDGHAMYTFYHTALPKAGYELLPDAAIESDVGTPKYRGLLAFKKGATQGAISIVADRMTIQVIIGK